MLTHPQWPGRNRLRFQAQPGTSMNWSYTLDALHESLEWFTCRVKQSSPVDYSYNFKDVLPQKLCSWDGTNIARWPSSVLPSNRAFPWAFSLTNVLRNSFILLFIHGAFNHTEPELRIQRGKRQGRPFAEGLGVPDSVPGPWPFPSTCNLSRFLWTIECIGWFQIVCSYKLYC